MTPRLVCSSVVLLLLAIFVAGAAGERPKIKDDNGNLLVKISDIPIGSCGDDSYFGLGIMDGMLEECTRWKSDNGSLSYEQHKCKVLRVHASIKNGKCECDSNWKGPICNEYIGCPEGNSLYGAVCTANVCQHGGTLAVGTKEIECICSPPWDGRYCDRLACWRKTVIGQNMRYRNNGDHCVCGARYTGENCDIIQSCMNNATLTNGKCICKDGWTGEVCDKRCPKGQVTCSACTQSQLLFIMSLIACWFMSR